MGKYYKRLFYTLPLVLSFILFGGANVFAQLNINASVTQNVSCFNGGDGEITLNIISGTAPFTVEFFLWDGSEIPIATITNTTDNVIVLSDNINTTDGSVSYTPPFPGFGIKANDNPDLVAFLGNTTYRVRVTSDDAGFNSRLITGLVINEPDELVASVVAVTDDCDNLGSGTIDIDVAGGTSPYTYLWSSGQTTQDVTGVAAGSYDVLVTDDNGCTFDLTGIVVNEGPDAGSYVGTAGEACTTDVFDLFSLLTGQDSGGTWSQSTGTGGTLNTSTGAVDFSGATEGVFTFKYTVTAGSCTPDEEDVTVNVYEAAIAEAGDDLSVCAGDVLNLSVSGTVSASNFSSLSWSSSGDGTFDDTSILEPVYTPGATDITNGTATLTLTANGNGSCDPDVDTMTLTITAAPTADAGSDEEVCSDVVFDMTASATSPTASNFSSVLWTTSGDGTFGDASSVVTTYTPGATDITNGTATLTLTANGNGSCDPAVDNMLLTITPAPLAEAGDDLSVCAGDVLNLSVSGTVSASNFSSVSWSSSGDGTFDDTSILEPVYTPGATDITNGTATLTLTASGNGSCDPDVDTMTLTITAAPTADAGSDETICAATAYDLSTSATPPTASNFSSVLWTTSGDGAFDDNTVLVPVYTPGANDATNGTVTLTLEAFGIGSCSSVTDNVVMTIIPQPAANAGSDEEICATDVFDMNLFATAPTVSDNNGLLWSTSGTGTFGDASQLITTYTPSAADIAAGTVTLTLTALGNANCTDVSDDMVLTITPDAIAEAGDDLSVCAGDALDLSVSGTVSASNFSSLSWSSSGDGAFDDTSVLDPVYTPGVADISNGTVVLTLTASGNGSCDPDVDTMTLTITAAPTADAGSDEEVCSDVVFDMSTSATSPTASNFSSVLWTTSGDGTFGDASSVVTTYTPGATDITNGTATLTLTANGNGSCDPAVDNMLLTITPAPLAEAGDDLSVCAGDVLNLSVSGTVSASNFSSLSWSSSGDGAFDDTSILDPVYTPGVADISNGTVVLTLTASGNGSCDPDVDTMTLTITAAPTADAGSDEEVCSDVVFDMTASATSPTASNFSSVLWTTSGDGTFGDASSVVTTYTPGATDITNGTATLTLTANGNGSCDPAVDNMLLTITPAPLAEAGDDLSVCAGDALDLSVSGTVSASNFSSLSWSSSGDGTFDDTSILEPVYTPGATDITNGTATLTLTANGNGSCDPDVDTMTLTITAAPTADAGSDETICAATAYDLSTSATSPTASNFSSVLWTTSGDGAFDDNTVLVPVYTPGANDATNGTVTLTLEAFGIGSCSSVTDNVVMTITPQPAANAGSDEEICATDVFDMNLFATAPTVSDNNGLLWSTSGTGTFGDASQLITTYTPSAADIAAGTVTLTLTALGNANCTDVSDDMVLTITPDAIAEAGDDLSVCAGDALDLSLSGTVSASNFSSVSWSSSGDGAFDDTSILEPVYTPGVADISNGTVVLTLTASGNGSCDPDVDTMTLTITTAPTADAGSDEEVCSDVVFDMTASATSPTASNFSSVLWTTSGDGTFGDASSVVTTYTPGATDITNGTATLTLTANGNGSCDPAVDNMLLTITPAPLAEAGSDSALCDATQIDLSTLVTAPSAANGSIQWTTASSDGSFSDATVEQPIYTFGTDDIANGTAKLYLTVTGAGSCDPAADSVEFILGQGPVVFAGIDSEICSNEIFDFASLAVADQPTASNVDSIRWETAGGDGAFGDIRTLLTTYTPGTQDSINGSVTLRLIGIGAASCVNDTSEMTLTITPAPLAEAGSDSTLCDATQIDLSTLVTAPSAANGSIQWTTASSDGSFSDATVEQPIYTFGTDDIANGTAKLYLTVTGAGSCDPAVDSVEFTISQGPVVFAGIDSEVCSNEIFDFASLAVADQPTASNVDSIRWETAGGDGAFGDIRTLLTTYTPGTQDSTNGSVTLRLIGIGAASCVNDTSTMTLTVSPAPNAGVGTDTTICNTTSSFDLNAQLEDADAGTWTKTGGTGSGEDNTNIGTGIIDFTSATVGTYEYTYTVAATANCPEDTEVVTITVETIAVQNVTNLDPFDVCAGEDIFVNLDGSESGVTYEVLVNGAPTTPATTAVGGASPLNITLASGLFADGDVISVEGSIGSSCVTAMNNTFTVNIVPGIAIQDVGTPSALNICSGTDLTVSLTGSELGVTYEALVNDSPTGAVASGVAGGAGISISVPSSEFGNGDVVSVQGSNGVCTELMNGDITLNVIEIIDQSIQNAGTVEICTGDQFILILDDSEIGVDYELFISTSATGLIKPGDGDSLAFVLPNVTFSNVDLSIRATSGSCSLFLSDEVYLITKDDIVRQNVTNSNPTQVCPGNDLIVSLDGSELGVDYEVLINGIASGTVLAGTGNPIDITLPSGNFVDGDSISVTGTFDACTYDMTGTFAVQEVSISISESITNPSACGASDGSIDIDVTGNNSGNFSFMWTLNGSATFLETTEDISGLSAGTYKVQVTDNITNCIDTALFTLQEPATYTVVGTEVDQQQCGVSDGSIDITVTPASATATFLWSGPGIDATNEANEDQNNLAPGSYEVTVSDNGCTVTEQFTIDPVQSIAATSNSNLATCGANDGVINVDVTQVGSNTYEIFVRDAGGTLVADSLNLDGTNNPIAFTGLGQGSYDITVRDAITNCEVTFTQVVNEDASFTIDNFSITDITTCGAPEGAISLTISGLSGSETFEWTDADNNVLATTQNLTNVSEAGVYTITIEDAGCTVVRSFTITQPSDCDFDCNDFKVTALTEAASCFGIKDGKIFFLLRNVSDSDELVASVKPAGAPDTDYVAYTIDNPGKGLIVEIEDEFTSGTYTVFLEDVDQSCTTIPFNVNIGTKFNITSNLDITQPTCEVSTGTITVSLNGTTDSFTFELYEQANPATPIAVNTNGIFNTVDEGDYFIRFINNNANGCSLPDQQVIINNTAVVSPGAVDINVQQPDCNNPFGVVSASLNNLPSNYEFILINQSGVEVGRNTTGIFSGLTIGTYLMQFVNTVDPGACEIPDRGNIIVQNSGSFTVTVSDTVDVKCFGSNTGSVVLTLDGLSTAFYSIDNGTSWEKFTSGNPITGLPAINNILVSDSVGAAGCNISVAVNIGTISSEINLAGSITLVTEASCTSSELIGEIRVPEITGGVAPYIYLVDNEQVTLDDSRIISGLSRTVRNLVVIDSAGCAKAFEIGSIVSPNEVRLLSVREIEPDNNCLNEPQGIKIAFSEATLLSVPGPYELVINKVGDTSSETIPLVSSGIADSVFIIGQDLFNFEKGASYRYTIRSVTNDQACSADGIIPINGGAIVPDFTLEGVDVACFGESGSIMISNIIADPTIPLFVELFIGNSTIADETFILDAIPQSRRFIIGVNNFGQVTAGDYFVRIAQLPQNCGNIAITSNTKEVAIDAPTNQLQVELVPEPNLAPGIVLDRENMNPMPTTRPDRANGAISIRLVSTTSALSYSAQIFLLEPLGGNNRSDYILPDEPQLFNSSQTLTFNNLLPGIYEIEYYDSFGCGLSGDRLVFGEDGTSNLVVDFDRSPFIPNLFTPNNDGKNDVFEILNLPDNGAELIVTNRSGAIVYKNDNYRPSDLWDGGDQPDGIYFYQLTVDNTVQNGWVEILRGRPRR